MRRKTARLGKQVSNGEGEGSEGTDEDDDFEVEADGDGYRIGGRHFHRPVQIGQSFATADQDPNDQFDMFVSRP